MPGLFTVNGGSRQRKNDTNGSQAHIHSRPIMIDCSNTANQWILFRKRIPSSQAQIMKRPSFSPALASQNLYTHAEPPMTWRSPRDTLVDRSQNIRSRPLHLWGGISNLLKNLQDPPYVSLGFRKERVDDCGVRMNDGGRGSRIVRG